MELFVASVKAFPPCAANGSERKIALLLVAFFIQPDARTQMSRYIYMSSNGCVKKAQMASHADKKVAISFPLVQLMRHLYAVKMHLMATRSTHGALC